MNNNAAKSDGLLLIIFLFKICKEKDRIISLGIASRILNSLLRQIKRNSNVCFSDKRHATFLTFTNFYSRFISVAPSLPKIIILKSAIIIE